MTLDELIKKYEAKASQKYVLDFDKKFLEELKELKAEQEKGMKWVKASERLPEVGKKVYIKIPGEGWDFKGVGKCTGDRFIEDSKGSIDKEFVEWLDESSDQNDWISVKQKLPNLGDRVLAIEYDGRIEICNYDKSHWCNKRNPCFLDEQDEQPGIVMATHWRPLPPPPNNK